MTLYVCSVATQIDPKLLYNHRTTELAYFAHHSLWKVVLHKDCAPVGLQELHVSLAKSMLEL